MRALVQVVGTSPSLTVPNAEDPQLIEWYGEVSTFFGRLYPPSLMPPPPQHSLAILSSSHPDLRPNVKRKFKRLGPFTAIGECHLCAAGLDTKIRNLTDDPQSYRVIMTAFPDIKSFIRDQLKEYDPPAAGPSTATS